MKVEDLKENQRFTFVGGTDEVYVKLSGDFYTRQRDLNLASHCKWYVRKYYELHNGFANNCDIEVLESE